MWLHWVSAGTVQNGQLTVPLSSSLLMQTSVQVQGMYGRPILYKNALDCARKIVAAQGMGGLYRGVWGSLLKVRPQWYRSTRVCCVCLRQLSRRLYQSVLPDLPCTACSSSVVTASVPWQTEAAHSLKAVLLVPPASACTAAHQAGARAGPAVWVRPLMACRSCPPLGPPTGSMRCWSSSGALGAYAASPMGPRTRSQLQLLQDLEPETAGHY